VSRAGLDVDSIVRTSIEIADAEGFERLTMRRLSAELGVTPMAIYHHVAGKEELLDLILDESLRPLPEVDVSGDPVEEIVGWFHGFHQLLVDHPALARVIGQRKLEGAVAGTAAERMMVLADATGLDEAAAVDMIVAAFSFALGSAFYRTSRLATDAEHDRDNAPEIVRRVQGRLAYIAKGDDHVVRGLTLLVAAYLS
jgi:AcrR family transcriptional regulator